MSDVGGGARRVRLYAARVGCTTDRTNHQAHGFLPPSSAGGLRRIEGCERLFELPADGLDLRPRRPAPRAGVVGRTRSAPRFATVSTAARMVQSRRTLARSVVASSTFSTSDDGCICATPCAETDRSLYLKAGNRHFLPGVEEMLGRGSSAALGLCESASARVLELASSNRRAQAHRCQP
jgi:hypothetical protein